MTETALQPGETSLAEVRRHWSYVFGSFWRLLGAVLTLGLAPYVLLRTNTLVITSRRLIRRSGVITRTVIEMELGRIAQVEVTAGLFDRLCGLGALKIIALDQFSFDFAPLKHPGELKDLIMGAAGRTRPGAPSAAGSQGETLAALERLGELRHKGILSDAEFEKKKAELLAKL